MDNPKKRGKDHLFNKKKYNKRYTKSTPPENTKTSTKLNLESNWDRYDDPIDDTLSTDSPTCFKLLSSAPIRLGGHFQFKNDKNFNSELLKTYSDIFTLDLDNLEHSLSCIPFYIRNNIDEDKFTENETKTMISDAENNKLIYENYLKKKGIDIRNKEYKNSFEDYIKFETTKDNQIENIYINKIFDNMSTLNIIETIDDVLTKNESQLETLEEENEDCDENDESIELEITEYEEKKSQIKNKKENESNNDNIEEEIKKLIKNDENLDEWLDEFLNN